MNTKFIQLTTKNGEALLLNPTFISSIETRLNSTGVSALSIVRTIDGTDHLVEEVVKQIVKKINDSEKYTMFKENPNFSL